VCAAGYTCSLILRMQKGFAVSSIGNAIVDQPLQNVPVGNVNRAKANVFSCNTFTRNKLLISVATNAGKGIAAIAAIVSGGAPIAHVFNVVTRT
jgi:hypothetical protein